MIFDIMKDSKQSLW